MIWVVVYVGLVLALFVRFQARDAALRAVPAPAPDEPLRLVAVHHALFYALLLVVAPTERLLFGAASRGQALGALAFASGVALYRTGATALGDALSPLVRPRPDGRLVTAGPYRLVRHPMYVGQLLIAFGAPLCLGCRWALAVSFAAAVVVVARARMEEDALTRTYAEYAAYRARAKRFVPYLF